MQNTGNNNIGQNNPKVNQPQQNQNKDNLDSRENLEQSNKGDDITHNRKEMKSDRKTVKNDNEHREL